MPEAPTITRSRPALESADYRLLREQGFELELASVAHYPDHEQSLRDAGVHAVFNFYASAGESFAEHVAETFSGLIDEQAAEPA